MSKTADFIIGCMDHAEWPPESGELVLQITDEVGLANLADELCDRAARACSGWQGCLRSNGDGRGTLCNPCPLTTLRDEHSAELEEVPS